jgi:orotate phosphoribosyltransferase
MALEESKLEKLCVGLYDRGALEFGDFNWTIKNGRKSPIYYNQREITSFSSSVDMPLSKQRELRELAVEAYSRTIDDLEPHFSGAVDEECDQWPYNHLYGIPESLTPLGSMVAHARGDSILWRRVEKKKHGKYAQIEGDFGTSDLVVALDDVVSDGESKTCEAEFLGQLGLDCLAFVIMLDREEGGAEKVRDSGYLILSALGLTKAIKMLKTNYRINTRQLDYIKRYHEQLREEGILITYSP